MRLASFLTRAEHVTGAEVVLLWREGENYVWTRTPEAAPQSAQRVVRWVNEEDEGFAGRLRTFV